MTISLVLSSYNGEKFIREQLESILAQTRQPDEVLIRDDGSSDKTVQICEEFIHANSLEGRWHVSQNAKNMGWAENFLNGFDQVSGDLIFPCDQDDIWIDNKIEAMEKAMSENQQIGLLSCGYIKQIEDGQTSKRENKTFSGNLEKLPFNSKILFMDYPGCVYCFRKSFWEEIKPYRFEGYPHDALLLRMGRLTGKAYYYDIPGIYWRRHLTNTTGEKVRENTEMQRRIRYYIACLEMMKKWCEDHHAEEAKKNLIDENIEFYRTRSEAFTNRKLLGENSLFSCLKYIKYYPRPRSIMGDVVRLLH